MRSLHLVSFNDLPIFVAFDAVAARAFADATDDDNRCAVSDTVELPLVDNYGFPCRVSDAGTLFPWLGDVEPETAAAMLSLPFYMTEAERERAELADDIAYWQARAA